MHSVCNLHQFCVNFCVVQVILNVFIIANKKSGETRTHAHSKFSNRIHSTEMWCRCMWSWRFDVRTDNRGECIFIASSNACACWVGGIGFAFCVGFINKMESNFSIIYAYAMVSRLYTYICDGLLYKSKADSNMDARKSHIRVSLRSCLSCQTLFMCAKWINPKPLSITS